MKDALSKIKTIPPGLLDVPSVVLQFLVSGELYVQTPNAAFRKIEVANDGTVSAGAEEAELPDVD